MPNEQVTWSGRFWLPEEPENIVPGELDVSGNRPLLRLSGALSPFLKEGRRGGVAVEEMPADTPGPRTIHGALMKVGPVTLLNAYQLRLTANPFTVIVSQPNSGLQEEVFEADYSILGLHASDANATFSDFRFRMQHQHAWAGLWGFSGSIADPKVKTEVKIKYAEPAPVRVPLSDGTGTLALEATVTFSMPRVAGAYILTDSWLAIETAEPVSIDAAWNRFVHPASVLLTLLYGKECPPVAFEVRSGENRRWCRVYRPGIEPDTTDITSSKIEEAPLLSRTQLGLERLASWFVLFRKLSPLPQLAAGAIEATGRSVENLLLELAAAAEGLHRRLHPRARRLSPEQTAAALQGIASLDVDQQAKDILRSAMEIYLWEPSFPKRLKALVEQAVDVIPGVAGDTKKWCDAVRDARNAFAHHLATGNITNEETYAYYTLQGSLRWLLTSRFLAELGVPHDVLAAAFFQYRPYQQFLANARRDAPDIYKQASSG